jgi:hypothetical protein
MRFLKNQLNGLYLSVILFSCGVVILIFCKSESSSSTSKYCTESPGRVVGTDIGYKPGINVQVKWQPV